MKWHHDKGWDVRYFGPYRMGSGAQTARGIEIVSNRERTGETRYTTVRTRYGYGERAVEVERVRHTVIISYGPWGERRICDALPFGSTLVQAKARAIELAREANADPECPAGFELPRAVCARSHEVGH